MAIQINISFGSRSGAKPPHRKRAVVIVAVFLAVSGVAAWQGLAQANERIPAEIRQKVAFPLYYPSELPEGFRVDDKSFSATKDVATYAFDGPDTRLAISVQPKPPGFSFDDFHSKQITGGEPLDTPVGKAIIGTLGDRLVSSIVTDRAWILINAPAKTETSVLERLSQRMQEVKD